MYVTEQVIKSVSQIQQVYNLQRIICGTQSLTNKLLGSLVLIYANLVILATAVTYYQLSGGESGTLRWLRSLLDKLDISC